MTVSVVRVTFVHERVTGPQLLDRDRTRVVVCVHTARWPSAVA
jgi:hypothetical protein